MTFPPLHLSGSNQDGSASAEFLSASQALGMDVRGLNPISQLQFVLANLATQGPPVSGSIFLIVTDPRFGAKGLGSAFDNAPAFNRAMAAASAAGGGIVYVPPALSYYGLSSAAIALPSNVTLWLASSAEIRQTGAFPAIESVGVGGLYSLLSEDAVAGEYTVTVDSTVGFVVGGMVFLQDQDNGEYAPNVVEEVTSSTEIALAYPISRDFAVADDSRLVSVTPVVKPAVVGGKVVTTLAQIAITFTLCDRPSVTDTEVNGGRSGILMAICLSVRVVNVSANGSGTVGPDGPCIGLQQCQSGLVMSARITNQLVDEPVVLYKNNQGILVFDCESSRLNGTGFQVDHENRDCTFLNCRTDGTGAMGFYNVNGNTNCWFINCLSLNSTIDAFNFTGAIGGGVIGPVARGQVRWGLNIDGTSSGVMYGMTGGLSSDGSGDISDSGTSPGGSAFSGASTFTARVGIQKAASANTSLSIAGLPISNAGLSTGDVWLNSNVLTIIP